MFPSVKRKRQTRKNPNFSACVHRCMQDPHPQTRDKGYLLLLCVSNLSRPGPLWLLSLYMTAAATIAQAGSTTHQHSVLYLVFLIFNCIWNLPHSSRLSTRDSLVRFPSVKLSQAASIMISWNNIERIFSCLDKYCQILKSALNDSFDCGFSLCSLIPTFNISYCPLPYFLYLQICSLLLTDPSHPPHPKLSIPL